MRIEAFVHESIPYESLKDLASVEQAIEDIVELLDNHPSSQQSDAQAIEEIRIIISRLRVPHTARSLYTIASNLVKSLA